MRRIQSPSSILTYKQCPRKYYYQYVLKLPTKENFHLVRGKIVHEVLQNFFVHELIEDSNYRSQLEKRILGLLKLNWDNHYEKMKNLIQIEEIESSFHETQLMLLNWLGQFFNKLETKTKKMSIGEAFKKLTPITEQEYLSPRLGVRGYIDAVENHDDIIHIVDYKTSKYPEISDSQELQLSIYALLYKETHGKMPDKVGIFFLADTEQLMDVTEQLIENAKKEIEEIHKNTESRKMDDYPMLTSPLCKWATGQCDFYENCSLGK